MNEIIDETLSSVEQLYSTLIAGGAQRSSNGRSATSERDLELVGQLHDQLDRMVAAIDAVASRSGMSRAHWSPRAAMWNEADAIVFAVDLPDVAEDDIEIKVEPFMLNVRGQRRSPWLAAGCQVTGSDLLVGTFSRSFALAVPVTREHVHAQLANGVLAIRVTTTAPAQPSKISIT
ncbi:MAG: Hsp20/alpha crystallin family protein [Kofleriaceae bacterium]